MRTTINILIVLLFNSALFAQKNNFKTFSIDLLYGDESIESYKLETFEKSGKYYVKSKNFERPNKSCNDSIWITEITEKKKKLCENFIQQLKLINPKKCEIESSAITKYTVKLKDTSFTFQTYCQLENVDFFKFRENLFQEKIREYKTQSNLEIKNIEKLLLGKWYYPNSSKALRFGDTIKLSRKEINADHFWTFGKRNFFKENSNDIYKLTQSNTFELFYYYEPRLNINPGIIENKSNGSSNVSNYGMRFTILKISNDELVLISLD
jgi:hypothetical protein